MSELLPPFHVASRTRPRRVAFLVDPAASPPGQLDAIMSASHRIWGGRLNPIIPVTRDGIDDPWWALLRFVDPDVIYTYVELSPELIDRIERELCPASIEAHRSTAEHFHPSVLSEQVAARSVSKLLVRGPPGPHRARAVACRAPREWPWTALLQRNLGLPTPDIQHEPPPEVAEWLDIEPDWDLADVLSRLAAYPGFILPPFAAGAYAMGAESTDDYKREFCLAIGEDVQTWIHFWNWPLSIGAHRRSSWNALCLPSAQVEDPKLIESLRAFLDRYALQSGPGFRKLDLVSYTHSGERLQRVGAALQGPSGLQLSIRGAGSLQFPILARRDPLPPDTRPSAWRGTGGQVLIQQVASSAPLLRAPGTDFDPSDGTRSIDLSIEYSETSRFFDGERLWWHLPRRRELAALFASGRSRVDRDGVLTLQLGSADTFELKIPSANDLIWSCLRLGGQRTQREALEWSHRPGTLGHASISDKGRYAMGVLDSFGGLRAAGDFFQHSFWRARAEALAGVDGGRSDGSIATIAAKLDRLKRSGKQGFDSAWLAKTAVRLVGGERSGVRDISLQELRDSFRTWAKRRSSGSSSDEGTRAASLDDTDDQIDCQVQEYVNRGVLQQGVNIRCSRCGTRDWTEVGSVAQESTCRGCRAKLPLPVQAEWRFRLNALVRNAVALHGVPAVISTLFDLRERARRFMAFVPGVVLRKELESDPEIEIDIVCVRDGKLLLCEVKPIPSDFTAENINRLAWAARELDADVAALAAFTPDAGSMATLRQKLDVALTGTRCSSLIVIPADHVFEPRALPY